MLRRRRLAERGGARAPLHRPQACRLLAPACPRAHARFPAPPPGWLQIYAVCQASGRIAYKRSGGSRLIASNEHWKSQIRHALYTGERFQRWAAGDAGCGAAAFGTGRRASGAGSRSWKAGRQRSHSGRRPLVSHAWWLQACPQRKLLCPFVWPMCPFVWPTGRLQGARQPGPLAAGGRVGQRHPAADQGEPPPLHAPNVHGPMLAARRTSAQPVGLPALAAASPGFCWRWGRPASARHAGALLCTAFYCCCPNIATPACRCWCEQTRRGLAATSARPLRCCPRPQARLLGGGGSSAEAAWALGRVAGSVRQPWGVNWCRVGGASACGCVTAAAVYAVLLSPQAR